MEELKILTEKADDLIMILSPGITQRIRTRIKEKEARRKSPYQNYSFENISRVTKKTLKEMLESLHTIKIDARMHLHQMRRRYSHIERDVEKIENTKFCEIDTSYLEELSEKNRNLHVSEERTDAEGKKRKSERLKEIYFRIAERKKTRADEILDDIRITNEIILLIETAEAMGEDASEQLETIVEGYSLIYGCKRKRNLYRRAVELYEIIDEIDRYWREAEDIINYISKHGRLGLH